MKIVEHTYHPDMHILYDNEGKNFAGAGIGSRGDQDKTNITWYSGTADYPIGGDGAAITMIEDWVFLLGGKREHSGDSTKNQRWILWSVPIPFSELLKRFPPLPPKTHVSLDYGKTFDGTTEHFADCFFSNATPDAIRAWAKEQGYHCQINGKSENEE